MSQTNLRIYLSVGVTLNDMPSWPGSKKMIESGDGQHIALSSGHMLTLVTEFFPRDFFRWLDGKVEKVTMMGYLEGTEPGGYQEQVRKTIGGRGPVLASALLHETKVSITGGDYLLVGKDVLKVLKVARVLEFYGGKRYRSKPSNERD